MVSGISKKKLKVVWICHFSNKEVRESLPLSQMKFKNFVKSILGKSIKQGYSDFAPWVTNLILEFEKIDHTEIHIIAPFSGLKFFTFEFEKNGIFYHFYKPIPGLSILHNPLINKLFRFIKLFSFPNRFIIKRFIGRIKPDIVNLIGTENPYYSIATLDIKNIPVYVSTQTVYTNPDRKKHIDHCMQIHWNLELLIHKKEIYYGCTGRMHRDLILKNNPNAIIFKMFFPIEKPKSIKVKPKIYDFVFFGGIEKKKGVEDVIEALAIVKKTKFDVTLNIVGDCVESYMTFLLTRINELGLIDNIVFNHHFTIHSDMYQHIVQSHFAVLPIKLDIISGAIVEAILLNLPVVTYKTTGTPYLNKDGDTVLLANIDDIEMLATQMLKLLNSPSLAEKIREKARAFVELEYDNSTSAKRLLNNYYAVIDHYYNNTPIPNEQLFNISEFPIY